MEKKTFIIFAGALVFMFMATLSIRYYRSPVRQADQLGQVPLAVGNWIGQAEPLAAPVMELLNPDQLFSATYVNPSGARVHLFVDYYSPENTTGAIHSPRNCLPGSGWVIAGTVPRPISAGGRVIEANRFYLTLGESQQVMDFWYITRQGETANDYRLKFNTMISSLTLKPTDKAFVRFVTANDPASIAAMEEFELQLIGEIYRRLPF